MDIHILNELRQQGRIKGFTLTVTEVGQTIYYVTMNNGEEKVVKSND
jgi:hypothetical protein